MFLYWISFCRIDVLELMKNDILLDHFLKNGMVLDNSNFELL